MKTFGSKKKATIQVAINKKAFNGNALTKEVQAEGRRIFEQAAIEFVQDAASKVPSLTGQAKSALINLATQLGLDPGISPDSPPISENMHLYFYLTNAGNSVVRGDELSFAAISTTRDRVFLKMEIEITAAHNGFGYFTYWDQKLWNSVDDAIKSMNRYIKENFVPPTVKVKNG